MLPVKKEVSADFIVRYFRNKNVGAIQQCLVELSHNIDVRLGIAEPS